MMRRKYAKKHAAQGLADVALCRAEKNHLLCYLGLLAILINKIWRLAGARFGLQIVTSWVEKRENGGLFSTTCNHSEVPEAENGFPQGMQVLFHAWRQETGIFKYNRKDFMNIAMDWMRDDEQQMI